MINKFTDRAPDVYTIDSSDSVRYFPDVEIGCWYYYAAVEASTAHTAHYEPEDPMEHWQDPQPGSITSPAISSRWRTAASSGPPEPEV